MGEKGNIIIYYEGTRDLFAINFSTIQRNFDKTNQGTSKRENFQGIKGTCYPPMEGHRTMIVILVLKQALVKTLISWRNCLQFFTIELVNIVLALLLLLLPSWLKFRYAGLWWKYWYWINVKYPRNVSWRGSNSRAEWNCARYGHEMGKVWRHLYNFKYSLSTGRKLIRGSWAPVADFFPFSLFLLFMIIPYWKEPGPSFQC